MDFFAPGASRTAVSAAPTDAPDPFAEAIGRRFGTSAPMLTARLLPDESPLDTVMNTPQTAGPSQPADVVMAPPVSRSASSQAATTLSSMSLGPPGRLGRGPAPMTLSMPPPASSSASDSTRYTAVAPKDLATFLALVPPPLILDVRSSAAHTISHVRGAISLSVPSTLLKRPKFSLTNLSTMIASASARRTFETWPTATRILVYDTDLSRLADGSGVLGLLRKLETAGFKGELAWLVGGHSAVARSASECLEAGASPSPEPENHPASPQGEFLNTHNLPQSAFQQSSTTGLGHRPNKLQPSNPFYDNIRQNQELSHGITERIPLSLPKEILSRKDEIPVTWLRDIIENSDKEKGMEALAMQFYRVELGEQRRLQGVMSHHSRGTQLSKDDQKQPDEQSGPDKRVDDFPYSIIAGVEKGSKNRQVVTTRSSAYKNIWPYEHARVRLQAATDDGSDYVNASYVQPRGTRLSYIATQGPMPTTYVDFWTMIWEQNVHVIVMLTRQIENNQLKCGDYWSGTQYGPLRLQLISTEGGEEEVECITGFDFGQSTKRYHAEDSPHTIRRTFALSHAEQPHVPPRKVVQFQFLSWQDMNVPDTPAGLLELVKNVREAADEAEKSMEAEALPGSGLVKNPVLVHCSAGVGRTGSFVAIDAILDGIRHDLDAQRQLSDTATTTTSSGSTSESDPENGNPSSESISNGTPSPRFRRASHPESDMRRSTTGVGLHMTPARQRQRSLRKMLGARRAGPVLETKNGSPPSEPEVTSGPQLGRIMDGADANAGVVPGAAPTRLFALDSADTAASSSTNSSAASFNFSAMALSSSMSSGAHGASKNGDLPARPALPQSPRSTQAWSSDVAKNMSRSDLAAPLPVPALSAAVAPSPRPDSAMENRERDTFDYLPPRSLGRGRNKPASPLHTMDEPIREVLEDMREQRMSLCQSLRQYVFVHRAVVEGVLAMVDSQRAEESVAVSAGAKRHASPTELVKVDMAGSKARVKKRPSALSGTRNGATMVVDS
ncbi:hypothetical protein FRC06_002794 [Ceratobasidium sp. 370]|nr:hypothetical protein FRC06_002794 [Ceratobasidium sp. 370]